MKKEIISLWIDSESLGLIDEAARQSGTNRSGIARILLQMIRHVPSDMFRERSPLPEFFGIAPGGENGNRS